VAGFLDSLPLMRDLKSDALRPRHWRALMLVTRQDFEMDPRTFTLGNMFAMQLHLVRSPLAVLGASGGRGWYWYGV
jgi:hypothetical protein